MRRWMSIAISFTCIGVLAVVCVPPLRARAFQAIRPKASIAERVGEYGEDARARWRPDFAAAEMPYPPSKVVLLAIKSTRTLEVHVSATRDGPTRRVRTMPILGMSGTTGPELRQGDRQVPEGFYEIDSLNPNSLYHLALRVSYPNAEDRAHAAREGRTKLGGDIMIHGNTASIGCLAMGDFGAEDLFILAADVGIEHVQVVISPVDFRDARAARPTPNPPWMVERYEQLARRMSELAP